jgi:uncharacterized membrane protein YjgN (DUF898 family)
MNRTIKSLLLCPVPEDQKPINEYINFKKNYLGHFTTLSNKNYKKKIIGTFFGSFFCISLVNFSLLNETMGSLEWLLKNVVFSIFFFILVFIILLLRWNKIKTSFSESRFFYEEASWYDGHLWEKPLSLIKNDKLIMNQKIKPINKRLRNTILFFFVEFLQIFLLRLIILKD